ncbi:MAG: amidohydrolase [Acidobacteriota bacterium]
MNNKRVWLLFLTSTSLGGLVTACRSAPEPADMVLYNGKIVTVDSQRPEAQGLAIRGDTIVAVGDNAEIEAYVGSATHAIDLEGKLAIPGFIEGHGHFMGIGQAKRNLDLTTAGNWEEIVEQVARAAKGAQPGDWILGRGWHQEKWDQPPKPNLEGLPYHDSLSRAAPDNPVLLTHASGHASFVNAKALELAGIGLKTADPPGGQIVRGRNGAPIGMLRETAQGLVRQALARDQAKRSAEEVEGERREQIRLAAQECLSKGITSFQDAGSSFATVDLLKSLVREGQLPLRLWVMLREDNEKLAKSLPDYKLLDFGDHRLTVRAIKRAIDGALGSHGAWLLQPYADMPSSVGLNTTSVESITETARLAIEHGFQLCVHAIGDRANRETLNLFEKTFKQYPDKKDLRWRIEHAQHLNAADIPRFAQLGVIASMQAIHCTSDAPWVPDRLGEERARETSYVWQKLMRSGAVVSNGTDAPVEDVSPIASFYAAVSRKLKDGTVFAPEQRMSREEALRSYTLNAAHAAFEEKAKGSLTPGKLADITVLSGDILTLPEDEIPDTEVVYTIVGGKVEYDASGD